MTVISLLDIITAIRSSSHDRNIQPKNIVATTNQPTKQTKRQTIRFEEEAYLFISASRIPQFPSHLISPSVSDSPAIPGCPLLLAPALFSSLVRVPQRRDGMELEIEIEQKWMLRDGRVYV